MPDGKHIAEEFGTVTVFGKSDDNTYAAVLDGEKQLPAAVRREYPEANAVLPNGFNKAADPTASDATNNLKEVAGDTITVAVHGRAVRIEDNIKPV